MIINFDENHYIPAFHQLCIFVNKIIFAIIIDNNPQTQIQGFQFGRKLLISFIL